MQPHATRTDQIASIGRTFAWLMFAAAAIVAAIALVGALGVARGRVEGRVAAPTLQVTGSGKVDVPPTEALMGVDIRGCAKGPSGALLDANNSFAAIRRAVAAADIPAKDISQGSIRTGREYATRPHWCTYIEVDVRVRELDRLPAVIQAIGTTRRGVAGLRGPTFDYGAEGELERRALGKAVAAARGKAEDAAERTGMRVVGVRSIAERGASVQRPNERSRYGSPGGFTQGRGVTFNSEALAAATDDARLAISSSSGQATAQSNVNVTFILERGD